MCKILVTGGLGYIGSHTVVELIKSGYEPIIVDNLSNSNLFILNQIKKIVGYKPKFYQFDLCNYNKLKSFSKKESIDGIIHFASLKSVDESISNPLKYYRNNLISLINLIDVYQDKDIKFIFSSSCTVYGDPDTYPVTEDSIIKNHKSPYGNTKKISEEILNDISGIKCISLRYFNPVGSHTSSLIGELPINTPKNLFPLISQTAIGKRGELNIYGDDYDTPDGTCIRDYIHVMDLAKAHVKCLEFIDNNYTSHECFNIGTGNGYSIMEVISLFKEISNVDIKYSIRNRRDGDIKSIWADSTKANQMMNWYPELTIVDMVESTWNWEKYLFENNI